MKTIFNFEPLIVERRYTKEEERIFDKLFVKRRRRKASY